MTRANGTFTLWRSARLTLLILFLGVMPLQAAQKSFSGSLSSDWLVAANWVPAGVPGPADDVTIEAGKIASLDSAATIQSLTLGGTLTGSGSLSVSGLTTWTAGSMAGSGVTNANGGVQIRGNAAKRLERTLNHSAAGSWSDIGTLSVSGTFNNLQGATFTILNDRPMIDLSPSGRFQNAGTVVKSTAMQRTLISMPFHNLGLVSVASGTLALEAGGMHGGRFEANGGTLELAGGDHVLHASPLSGAMLFSGANVVVDGLYQASTTAVSAGNVAFTGSIAVMGPLTVTNGTVTLSNVEGMVQVPSLRFSAGTIAGTSSLNISGRLQWSGGTMAGTGVTNANGGMSLEGNSARRLDRILNHSGEGTWTGNANLGISGTFNNLAGATFEIQNDRAFAGSGTTARVNNAGTFRKTMGMPTSTSGVAFENSGLVEIVSGALSFNPSYVQSAGVTRLQSGTFLRSTNPVTFSGGRLEGSGSVEAPLISAAEVRPGLEVGTLLATRGYAQQGSGVLRIEVSGTASGQFDQLAVSGLVMLAGQLRVDLAPAYVPQPGDRFTILTFEMLEGGFTSTQGLLLGNGRGFSVLTQPTAIQLQYGIENCGDGIDNDADARADCNDAKCADNPSCMATPTSTASPSPSPTTTPCLSICTGDCNCDARVSRDELVTGLALALEAPTANACLSFDHDSNRSVTIEELVAAVSGVCSRT